MTTKTNRISNLEPQRILLPDGNYFVIWRAGIAGKVGELRDWQGKLIQEFETVGKIPLVPLYPPEPEPLARWQVALWRLAVGFAVGLFWYVAWRLTW